MGTTKNLVRIIRLAAIAVMLSACGRYDWRQKLTVTIDTPSGVVQASSVMAYRVSDDRHPCLLPEACGVRFELRGEAVVLQVATGKYLFALLKGVPSLAEQIYPKTDAAESGKLLESGNDAGAGAFPLDPKHYPLLVTFDDINNPASVKRVDPGNLEAIFGPGYRLEMITLTLTNEPVTKGQVEKILGWLRGYPSQLDGSRFETTNTRNPFANSLSAGSFTSGRS
jgi:hypothetical protein